MEQACGNEPKYILIDIHLKDEKEDEQRNQYIRFIWYPTQRWSTLQSLSFHYGNGFIPIQNHQSVLN